MCIYGVAVRQRTNRQQTTMARHGTMPEIIYQRHLHISERVEVSGVATSTVSRRAERFDEMLYCDRDAGYADDAGGEVIEYDSSSDEDEPETDVSKLNILLPPQGFGPEAKTRGGTLGFPVCIHIRNFKM